jgi:hypothetical protein
MTEKTGLDDLLQEWEQATIGDPPPEVAKKLDRIGNILTVLCEPLGGSTEGFDLMVRTLDEECKSFLVGTPWGSFAIYDNGHEDHWCGGEVTDNQQIRRIPGCFELHDVIRLHLMVCIDACLMRRTQHMDGMPPPEQMH